MKHTLKVGVGMLWGVLNITFAQCNSFTWQEGKSAQEKPSKNAFHQSPFCLWTMGPFAEPERARKELTFIKDLGVKLIVVPSFPLNFEKEYADTDFSQAKKSFEVYKDSGLIVVPVSEDPIKVSVKEFSDAVKKALKAFPQNKYWALYTEIDSVVGLTKYEEMTDFQDNYFKSVARKWALYTRVFYRLIKEANSDYQVVGPGTGGAYKSYLVKGEKYSEEGKTYEMKHNGFFAHYMDGLKEFKEIEKTPKSYNWLLNEFKLSKEEFDIVFSADKFSHYFDAHHYSNYDGDASKYYENTTKLAKAIKALFKKHGYEKAELWLSQTSTHTGKIESGMMKDAPQQTEEQQAAYLVKKYITAIASGVKKICWTGPFEMGWPEKMEFVGHDNPPNYQHFFSQVGLIYDGNGKYDEGAKIGKKDEVKKLAYYTYKKMVEILEGSDWEKIETVHEKDGVYLYRVRKNGKPIWVAWNDHSGNRTVTIEDITSKEVRVTKAVPKGSSGKEVANYKAAFEAETKTVRDRRIELTLGWDPVFVENQ